MNHLVQCGRTRALNEPPNI
uniref:Uncharacterized protein n=1 Tax=Rhizophora mucronata TaxID=61149 RepID=A0A2P2N847_RHIMU